MDQAGHRGQAAQVFDLGPRSAWVSLTAGVALICLMEGIAVVVLTAALLPPVWAVIAAVALLAPAVLLLVVMASTLTGRIVVDGGVMTLRFGLLGGTAIPRALITRVERCDPDTQLGPIGLGIEVPFGSDRATVTWGGPTSYVRVTLRRPTRVRLTVWRHAVASELLVSTSQPDELVESLV